MSTLISIDSLRTKEQHKNIEGMKEKWKHQLKWLISRIIEKKLYLRDTQINTFATIIQEQIPVASKQEVLNNSVFLFPFLL